MASISFSSLPWIFQKRFTEICDTETMKKFQQLSHGIQKVSNNRKICKWIQIGYKKPRECLPGIIYQNVNLSSIKNIEILDEMIIDLVQTKITKEFIQSFSFIASKLKIVCFQIEFNALKELLGKNLQSFAFSGRIEFKNIHENLEYLIYRMSEINEVVFTMRFDFEDEIEIKKMVEKLREKYQGFFDFWRCKYLHFAISKNYY
uniref:Uncharacterized protein n=1 Tax=Panagrolaimus davidi TaxID=227884 RepID=A0A914QZX7_9BILA